MAHTEELLDVLREVRQLHPDWRFGQLLSNVAARAGSDEPASVWDVTDEQLIRAAREHLAQYSVDARQKSERPGKELKC